MKAQSARSVSLGHDLSVLSLALGRCGGNDGQPPSVSTRAAAPVPAAAPAPTSNPPTTTQRWARATLAACVALLMSAWLTACGGSDDPAVPPPAPPPSEGSATIGAAGGFVDGPDGVRLGVPPGAVDSDVTFRIARDGSGAPPLPGGIDLLSAVYAITPHGQVFNQPVAVRVPSDVAQAAGRPTFLMKAEPGGRWAAIGTNSGAVDALTASIDSLSYVAVGACTNNLPSSSPFAQNCPTSNVLRFELLTDSGDPFPVSQDTTYSAIQPVLLVTTPTVLTGRITWTRAPFAAARVDTLETGSRFTGTATGVIVQRQLGIAWSAEAPNVREVTQNFTSTFAITVTPAQVASARNPNGVVRPLWAQARAGEWEYNAVIPIRIRDVSAPTPAPAPAPMITQQPANAGVVEGQPASFSVVASVTPAAALTYQWSRRADANAALAPIAGATAATFNLAATALSDNGSQFQVAVCAAPSLCVISNPATLTVTQAPVAPSFTLQPANIAVVAGQTASFTVTATGNPLPRIDWQSATASDPNNFTSLSVAPNCVRTDPPASGTSTTATCTVGPLAIADSGRRYRAAATNGFTTTSAVATLTVNAAPVAPAITQQPQAQTTTVGGSATFSVTATGTAPLNYTWRLNGTPLPAMTGGFGTTTTCSGTVTYGNGNATITLSGLSAVCNGALVDVTVSNGVNPSAVSNSVTLTVNQASTSGACFSGASGWCYANPLPQAGDLAGLVYNPSTATFTAVGDAGVTLRTADLGATWQVAFETGRTDFTDLASPSLGLLVAAGAPPLGSGQNTGVFTRHRRRTDLEPSSGRWIPGEDSSREARLRQRVGGCRRRPPGPVAHCGRRIELGPGGQRAGRRWRGLHRRRRLGGLQRGPDLWHRRQDPAICRSGRDLERCQSCRVRGRLERHGFQHRGSWHRGRPDRSSGPHDQRRRELAGGCYSHGTGHRYRVRGQQQGRCDGRPRADVAQH